MQLITAAIDLQSDAVAKWAEFQPYVSVPTRNLLGKGVIGELYMCNGAVLVSEPAYNLTRPGETPQDSKFVRVFGEDVITIRAYPYCIPLHLRDSAVLALGVQLGRYLWQPGVQAGYLFVSNVISYGAGNHGYVYAGIAAVRQK